MGALHAIKDSYPLDFKSDSKKRGPKVHLTVENRRFLSQAPADIFSLYSGNRLSVLRPSELTLSQYIEARRIALNASAVSPALVQTSEFELLYSLSLLDDRTIFLPFGELRLRKSDAGEETLIEVDPREYQQLADDFCIDAALKMPMYSVMLNHYSSGGPTKPGAPQYTMGQIDKEHADRSNFFSKMHSLLDKAVKDSHSLSLVFVDFDKSDWVMRPGSLMSASDLVCADEVSWRAKYKNERFELIRSEPV